MRFIHDSILPCKLHMIVRPVLKILTGQLIVELDHLREDELFRDLFGVFKCKPDTIFY